MNKFNVLKVAVVSIFTVTFTNMAHAGKVTQWSYENQAGFIFATPDAVTESDFQAADVLSIDTYKKLSWGDAITSNGQSQLIVNSPITGSITTVDSLDTLQDSDFEDGTDVIHNNYRIGGGGWLTSAVLLDGLRLNIDAWDIPVPVPASSDTTALEIAIAFDFIETPNRPDGEGTLGGTCADGSAAGTDIDDLDPQEGFGCDDYFILQPIPGIDFAVINGGDDLDPTNDYVEFGVVFDLIDFGMDPLFAQVMELETKYEVTTRLTGLTISTDFCGDQTAPCVGFSTKELESNQLLASFAVQAVPEPLVVLLFGSGLIFISRFRVKK